MASAATASGSRVGTPVAASPPFALASLEPWLHRERPTVELEKDDDHILHRAPAALTVFLLLSACGGAPGDDITVQAAGEEWGPLAVVAGSGSGGEALAHGTLQVTDHCVLLDESGEDVLLLWPADRTSWDPDTRTVTFEKDDGEAVPVGDGDEVRLGRGGSSIDEGGPSDEEFLAAVEWESEPAESCLTDARWGVNSVERVGE